MPESAGDRGGAALAAALAEELDRLQALQEALAEEREALLGREPADVEAAVARKAQRLDAFRTAQDARLAATAGEPLGAAIEARDQRAANRAARERLLTLGSACEALNRDNGRLIARLQTHTREALAVLRNSDAGPRLYAIDGSRDDASDRQSLGKA